MFDRRPLRTDGALIGDSLAAEANAIRNMDIRRDPAFDGLSDRVMRVVDRILGELDAAVTTVRGLEENVGLRFAIGYQSVVSDHLPLLIEIDLDRPLAPWSSGRSSASPPRPSSPGGGGFDPLRPPRNAEDFLRQQGGGDTVLQRYRDFLSARSLVEGSATSDRNACLLDTLGQLMAEHGRNPNFGVAPGPMLAIGAAPFPAGLRERGITVHLFMLNNDGTVVGPIPIGHPTGITVGVLHYGAHYVPLRPA